MLVTCFDRMLMVVIVLWEFTWWLFWVSTFALLCGYTVNILGTIINNESLCIRERHHRLAKCFCSQVSSRCLQVSRYSFLTISPICFLGVFWLMAAQIEAELVKSSMFEHCRWLIIIILTFCSMTNHLLVFRILCMMMSLILNAHFWILELVMNQ